MYDATNPGGNVPATNDELRRVPLMPSIEERQAIPGYQKSHPIAEKAIIHLHYQLHGNQWWIAELWQDEDEAGLWFAFGYTELAIAPGEGEWGNILMNELEAIAVNAPAHPSDPILHMMHLAGVQFVIERDTRWVPRPAHECIPGITLPKGDTRG